MSMPAKTKTRRTHDSRNSVKLKFARKFAEKHINFAHPGWKVDPDALESVRSQLLKCRSDIRHGKLVARQPSNQPPYCSMKRVLRIDGATVSRAMLEAVRLMCPDHEFTTHCVRSLSNAQIDISDLSGPGPDVRVQLKQAVVNSEPPSLADAKDDADPDFEIVDLDTRGTIGDSDSGEESHSINCPSSDDPADANYKPEFEGFSSSTGSTTSDSDFDDESTDSHGENGAAIHENPYPHQSKRTMNGIMEDDPGTAAASQNHPAKRSRNEVDDLYSRSDRDVTYEPVVSNADRSSVEKLEDKIKSITESHDNVVEQVEDIQATSQLQMDVFDSHNEAAVTRMTSSEKEIECLKKENEFLKDQIGAMEKRLYSNTNEISQRLASVENIGAEDHKALVELRREFYEYRRSVSGKLDVIAATFHTN